MNINILNIIVIDLHVFPELTTSLLSLKNKMHSTNDQLFQVRTGIYHLLEDGYTYQGYTMIEKKSNNYVRHEYHYNNQAHRIDGPAYIQYRILEDTVPHRGTSSRRDNTRVVELEEYYRNNQQHREDGPAVMIYRILQDGTRVVDYEEYYQNNQLHRIDGPAIIQYEHLECEGSITTRIMSQRYYHHGQQLENPN